MSHDGTLPRPTMLLVEPKHLLATLAPNLRERLESAVKRTVKMRLRDITVEQLLLRLLVEDPETRAAASQLRLPGGARLDEGLDPALREHLGRLSVDQPGKPHYAVTLMLWLQDAWVVASLRHGQVRTTGPVLLSCLLEAPRRYLAPDLARHLEGIDASGVHRLPEAPPPLQPEHRRDAPQVQDPHRVVAHGWHALQRGAVAEAAALAMTAFSVDAAHPGAHQLARASMANGAAIDAARRMPLLPPETLVQLLRGSACFGALEDAVLYAMAEQHGEVTAEHMLLALLDDPRSDASQMHHVTAAHLRACCEESIQRLGRGHRGRPAFSVSLLECLQDAWILGYVSSGESRLRDAWLLVALHERPDVPELLRAHLRHALGAREPARLPAPVGWSQAG
ncbi:MAG: hypothetical protein KC731_14650 [Myxococcales bacterium]|nr:hypothetical protein [Myxococcales bacterium]